MSLDIARLRAETPGCANVTHFNNAGASLQPARVLDAVVEHLRHEGEVGGYEAAAERADRLEHTYDALARLIGARTRRDRSDRERDARVGHGVLRIPICGR